MLLLARLTIHEGFCSSKNVWQECRELEPEVHNICGRWRQQLLPQSEGSNGSKIWRDILCRERMYETCAEENGNSSPQVQAGHERKKVAHVKGVGEGGRLTDKVIDRIQNYHGIAIKENSGNLNGIKDSINAIKCHMIENKGLPLQKQHRYCPKRKIHVASSGLTNRTKQIPMSTASAFKKFS